MLWQKLSTPKWPMGAPKFSREERGFIARVMSRLRARPAYLKLHEMGTIWGLSKRYVAEMIETARAEAKRCRAA